MKMAFRERFGFGTLTLAVVGWLATSTSLHAELPPGSYDKLRAEAQEALVIDVINVKSKELSKGKTEVTAEVKVLAVERSKAGLKKGEKATLTYTSIDPAKLGGFTGPRPVPILKQGEVCPAFLNKTDAGTYEPAAYGESFVMTPEG